MWVKWLLAGLYVHDVCGTTDTMELLLLLLGVSAGLRQWQGRRMRIYNHGSCTRALRYRNSFHRLREAGYTLKTIRVPSLMYGCETLTMSEAN